MMMSIIRLFQVVRKINKTVTISRLSFAYRIERAHKFCV